MLLMETLRQNKILDQNSGSITGAVDGNLQTSKYRNQISTSTKLVLSMETLKHTKNGSKWKANKTGTVDWNLNNHCNMNIIAINKATKVILKNGQFHTVILNIKNSGNYDWKWLITAIVLITFF